MIWFIGFLILTKTWKITYYCRQPVNLFYIKFGIVFETEVLVYVYPLMVKYVGSLIMTLLTQIDGNPGDFKIFRALSNLKDTLWPSFHGKIFYAFFHKLLNSHSMLNSNFISQIQKGKLTLLKKFIYNEIHERVYFTIKTWP